MGRLRCARDGLSCLDLTQVSYIYTAAVGNSLFGLRTPLYDDKGILPLPSHFPVPKYH